MQINCTTAGGQISRVTFFDTLGTRGGRGGGEEGGGGVGGRSHGIRVRSVYLVSPMDKKQL